MEKTKEIIWTETAVNDLREIYNYLSCRSISAANKLIDKLVHAPEIIAIKGFQHAFVNDEYNKNYKRLISGNYKILFSLRFEKIVIQRIFDTRQNPAKLNQM